MQFKTKEDAEKCLEVANEGTVRTQCLSDEKESDSCKKHDVYNFQKLRETRPCLFPDFIQHFEQQVPCSNVAFEKKGVLFVLGWCLQEGIVLDGRKLNVTIAVPRQQAVDLKQKTAEKDVKDKRNLWLVREGSMTVLLT